MTLATILTVFAVIFLAELPDKSLFASLVLGTRLRPVAVWLGVATAFTIHVVIAVAAGGALALLPDRLVGGITAVLFLIGAVLLLRPAREEADPEPVPTEEAARPVTFGRAAAVSFGIVFLGEWGDLTQIATANLSARYQDPLSVGVGALLGLWAVAALAIGVGRGLLRILPLTLVRRVAGLIFLALGVFSMIEAVRG